MSLHELDKATALSRWNLDVGDLAEALEERAQLIFSDVPRQTADEDGGIVGIGELVHRLRLASVVRWHGRTALHSALHAALHVLLRSIAHRSATHHRIHATRSTLVLGSSSRDTHGPISTVDALHLTKSTLLV